MEDKLKQQEMKQQNDLSDIVLEKESNSAERTKKLLLYAATLILLFLVALVVMKLLNTTPEESSANLAQVGNEVQQSADESVDQISQKLEDTNKLFQQEPIIDESAETDLKFEEMVRKLKAQDASESADLGKVIEKPAVAAKEKAQESATAHAKSGADQFSKKAEEIAKAAAKTKKEAAAKVHEAAAKLHKTAPEVIAPKIVTPKAKPHAPAHKREEIVRTKTVPAGHETMISSLSGYFIQVGATANTFPDRRYLQKIKNAGYDYIVHSMTIKGRKIKKILIGPFASKSEAKSRLPGVRAKINPSAYIYRVQ